MFDAKKEIDRIVNFIREYYKENNLGGAVLGISGGKDSAVVAALMVKALGSDNVIGLTLPCHSNSQDKSDAKVISDYYGFKMYDIDLTSTFDAFHNEICNSIGTFSKSELENSEINLKPRLRMAAVYYMSALLSAVRGKTYLVVGTSNKCERYVGYFTKGGDSVSDIAPIAEYTVSEVIAMGEELGVPVNILYKKPSDGLSNLSDEDKLGVTYNDIEVVISGGNIKREAREKIKKLHDMSMHKFNTPTCKRDWQ